MTCNHHWLDTYSLNTHTFIYTCVECRDIKITEKFLTSVIIRYYHENQDSPYNSEVINTLGEEDYPIDM